jgi:hypothetical protein
VAVFEDASASTIEAISYSATASTKTLTVAKTGSGKGTVTSTDGKISCGSRCAHGYPQGTAVTLTAKPAAGSMFSGWSGGGCSGTGKCKLTISTNTSVHASLTVVPPPNTTITHLRVSKAARKATVSFTGSGGVGKLHFQCRLDKGSWRGCASPKTYSGLARGHHTVEVRAIDSRGKTDPTPASHSFTS